MKILSRNIQAFIPGETPMPDIMCALQDQDHWKPSQPGHSTRRFRHLLTENLVGSALLCTGLILGSSILSSHFVFASTYK